MIKFIVQNLQAHILDSTVVLTIPRKLIKNYSHFFFIYNGAKTSYNYKLHFNLAVYLIKSFIILRHKFSDIFLTKIPSDD